MFKENQFLRKISEREGNNGKVVEYSEKAYDDLDENVKNRFLEKKQKELGFSYVNGGEETSILISGSHAADLAKTSLNIDKDEIEFLNKEEERGERYRMDDDEKLMIGKHYINASVREKKIGEYKADSGVSAMGIELQDDLILKDSKRAPNLLLYELPQVFSEPNKVDSKSRPMAVVDLSVYNKFGIHKLEQFITRKGVSSITSEEVALVRRGDYSKISEDEIDLDKKGALLECEKIVQDSKGDEGKYRKIIASLGILKIHRKYYEKQEELLYGNPDAKFPINLDIHTAFDSLKQEEGFDAIIGSRMGSSVSDPEVEMLFSLILKKHGFKVNLSSFNNFPIKAGEKEKDGLRRLLESTKAILSQEQVQLLDGTEEMKQKEDVLAHLDILFDRRLEKMGDSRKLLLRFLDWKDKQNLVNENSTDDEIRDIAKKVFLEEATEFSLENLVLLLKQNLVNLFLSGKTHDDRFRGGLMGLSSLQDKFDAKDKYEKARGSKINPEIFQIEIIASIMKNKSKRKDFEDAIEEFFSLVQQKDFEPKEVLKKIINQQNFK